MLHININFDNDWPPGLRDIQVESLDSQKKFHHSRASNSKANIPIWPKFELRQDFMPVPVTCKFDEDPIKSEVAILRTIFSPLYRWENFSSLKGESKLSPNLKQGSYCILKLGVHLLFFLIFVPSMYMSIKKASSFLGYTASFWG